MDFSQENNQTNQIIMGIIWGSMFLFISCTDICIKLLDKLCLIQFISISFECIAR